MKLTRRELLRRMGILATGLSASRLINLPDGDEIESLSSEQATTAQAANKINLAHSSIDMCFDPGEIVSGWACKKCYSVNGYWVRKCTECDLVETAIPEQWTCPTCDRVLAWGNHCSCYRAAYHVRDKINPFWIG